MAMNGVFESEGIRRCQACNGEGFIVKRALPPASATHYETCTACNGSGLAVIADILADERKKNSAKPVTFKPDWSAA